MYEPPSFVKSNVGMDQKIKKYGMNSSPNCLFLVALKYNSPVFYHFLF